MPVVVSVFVSGIFFGMMVLRGGGLLGLELWGFFVKVYGPLVYFFVHT